MRVFYGKSSEVISRQFYSRAYRPNARTNSWKNCLKTLQKGHFCTISRVAGQFLSLKLFIFFGLLLFFSAALFAQTSTGAAFADLNVKEATAIPGATQWELTATVGNYDGNSDSQNTKARSGKNKYKATIKITTIKDPPNRKNFAVLVFNSRRWCGAYLGILYGLKNN